MPRTTVNGYTPTDYDTAAHILAGGRDKSERTIANNTKLVRRGNDIAVRLHRTDVVTFHRDGTVTFNTGGWNTVTTRDRLNTYAPAGIRFGQKKGTLYAYVGGGWDNPVPFRDGMRYDPRRGRLV
jgi:hypothetical protein